MQIDGIEYQHVDLARKYPNGDSSSLTINPEVPTQARRVLSTWQGAPGQHTISIYTLGTPAARPLVDVDSIMTIG